MILRLENWSYGGPTALRGTIFPALYVKGTTVNPIEIPTRMRGKHTVIVRALAGHAFVQIGPFEEASEYDPPAKGRLLLEGEEQKFFVWSDSYVMAQEWDGDLDSLGV